MKVKCIKKGSVSTLTEGEIYEVVSESRTMYRIVGDHEVLESYFKERFEVIE